MSSEETSLSFSKRLLPAALDLGNLAVFDSNSLDTDLLAR